MPRAKDSNDGEGESNDSASHTLAAHVAAPLSFPVAAFSAIQSAGAQFPFLDPNVLMMTNAAAMAAVGASMSSAATGGSTAIPNGMLSAAHKLFPGAHVSSGQLSPHMAATALLSGTAGAPAHLLKPASVGQHADSAPSTQGVASSHQSYAPSIASGSMSNVLLPNMQSWSLVQLEQHVNLLQQMNQPVPQSVALLLADARRKEDKRTAKRVANRKSACTSRARKKALVEEMTRTNARLRRQALILELLPDLVIAITVKGEITFCSAQVERVLRHQINDLVGAKLRDLLVPASRDTLRVLIKALVKSEIHANASTNSGPAQAHGSSQRRRSTERNSGDTTETKAAEENNNGNRNSDASGRGSSRSRGRSSGTTSAAAIVSEQSFPLSVVEVESKQSARPARDPSNVNSDTSTSNVGGKQPASSSLTNSTTNSRSPTASFSGEDDAARGSQTRAKKGKRRHNSDDSSSLSSDAKNVHNAYENLDRNVRRHNQRMMGDSGDAKLQDGPKDDVTGASVTRNNATARLSSLQHVPELSLTKAKSEKSSRYESNGDQSSSDDSLLAGVEEKKKGENVSDDSGYRESNDSREETSSSSSDTSNSNGLRRIPLAKTCQICLIRDDLSTVWCEVTSSIKTRSSEEEPDSSTILSESMQVTPNPKAANGTQNEAVTPPKEETKEILLCLRPVRDGDQQLDESLRFKPKVESSESSEPSTSKAQEAGAAVSSSSTELDKIVENSKMSAMEAAEGTIKESSASLPSKRPPKKRPPPSEREIDQNGSPESEQTMISQKRRRTRTRESSRSPTNTTDTEKSVVESLMLMSHKSQ